MSTDALHPIVYETHSGLVILVGQRAFKVKKAVTTPFLDFGTVERRQKACQRELELNRRLAPDAYLGVGELIDPTGGPPEPVLFMRRMPTELRLSTLARSGQPVTAVINAIAASLTAFHAAAERGPEVDAEGRADALHDRWAANLRELADLGVGVVSQDVIERVERLAIAYVSSRGPLFEERIAGKHLIDGHGDLIADDIFCLPDGPRMLDCLDFDDRLRFVDVADDVAFLQMDLEYLGRADLADVLGAAYDEHSGYQIPTTLRHHYIAYRALVRAKVDLIQWRQGRSGADDDALRHLRLAIDHLEAGAIRLTLVGGLPGTGKTTLAKALAAEVGAVMISSDAVRRQLQADGVIAGEIGEFGQGMYAPHLREAVYRRMIELAGVELRRGRCVVLDASWTRETDRALARELAAATSSALVELLCTVPLEIAAERIRNRRNTDSDATPAIAAAMSAVSMDWPEATIMDTRVAVDSTLRIAAATWRRAAIGELERLA